MSDIPQYAFKVEDIIKSGRTTRSNIEEVKKWLSLNSDIPQMADEQVALFLIACNNVIDATETTIEYYFKHKANTPEIFLNRDIDSEEVQFTLGVASYAQLPKRTKENYALLMAGLKDTYYYNFNLAQQFKMASIVIDHVLYSNPPSGLVIVINMKGVIVKDILLKYAVLYIISFNRSYAVIPRRTDDNLAIMVGSIKDTRYSVFDLAAQFKLIFLMSDFILQSDPPKGLIAIADLTGVGLMHLTRMKVDIIKKGLGYLQEAMPTQLKRIHILNCNYVVDKILYILKPFMRKDLFDSIITHPANAPMEEFFEKYIPASCMPRDFGGDLPPLEELSEKFQKDCRKLKAFLDADERQIQRYKDNVNSC